MRQVPDEIRKYPLITKKSKSKVSKCTDKIRCIICSLRDRQYAHIM